MVLFKAAPFQHHSDHNRLDSSHCLSSNHTARRSQEGGAGATVPRAGASGLPAWWHHPTADHEGPQVDDAEGPARAGHLPPGQTRAPQTVSRSSAFCALVRSQDAGTAVPGADQERDGVCLLVQRHYRVGPQAEKGNTGERLEESDKLTMPIWPGRHSLLCGPECCEGGY